jgi:hypothetical protein
MANLVTFSRQLRCLEDERKDLSEQLACESVASVNSESRFTDWLADARVFARAVEIDMNVNMLGLDLRVAMNAIIAPWTMVRTIWYTFFHDFCGQVLTVGAVRWGTVESMCAGAGIGATEVQTRWQAMANRMGISPQMQMVPTTSFRQVAPNFWEYAAETFRQIQQGVQFHNGEVSRPRTVPYTVTVGGVAANVEWYATDAVPAAILARVWSSDEFSFINNGLAGATITLPFQCLMNVQFVNGGVTGDNVNLVAGQNVYVAVLILPPASSVRLSKPTNWTREQCPVWNGQATDLLNVTVISQINRLAPTGDAYANLPLKFEQMFGTGASCCSAAFAMLRREFPNRYGAMGSVFVACGGLRDMLTAGSVPVNATAERSLNQVVMDCAFQAGAASTTPFYG